MAQFANIEAPSCATLLKTIQGERFNVVERNTLVLISLDSLPEATDQTFWTNLEEVFTSFIQNYGAQVYQISRVEFGLLLKVTDINQININSTLKYDLLRLIQRNFPDFFGMIDQSRLIRNIDLRLRMKNAVAYLDAKNKELADAKSGSVALRPLREQDILRVHELLKKIGPESFIKHFVKSQPIVAMKPGSPPVVIMHEYFVAMEDLRRQAFPEVQLRGSGNVFNQLTIELDNVLMTVFGTIFGKGKKASINLNVESVFTPTFEKFRKSFGSVGLANLVVEFRQSDILQHYSQFEVAARTIHENHGNIVVDGIHPETIGVMNIGRIGASMAKIVWQHGAESKLPELKKELDYMRGDNRVLIMSRVDEQTAIDLCHSLGINMFQGFLIDNMVNPKPPEEKEEEKEEEDDDDPYI